jgi:acetylglutamate kinase
VAASLAGALKARKVLFLTDVVGLLADAEDHDSLISECTLGELTSLLESGAIGGGMLPKLTAVRDALEHGVSAAHIVDGRVEHSVLIELFSEAGIGTKITP